MLSSKNIKKTFGTNLKKLRNTYNDLTQEKLSGLINLDSQSIKFIETGRTFISAESLAELCNYFNVEPDFFFKSEYTEATDKDIDMKTEINRLLADCDYEKLRTIYNIICALKK